MPVRGGLYENLRPKGYQQITTLSSAVGLTMPTGGCTVAVIQAESKSVRYRDDGSDPSGTVGMVIAAGESITYTGSFSAVKFIETAASAKLNVLYYD